jgi:hypothetical protein
MESLKRAPNYSLVGEFEASRALAAVQKGDCVVCNGYEYVHLQIIPTGGSVTVDIGYWSEGPDPAAAILAEPAESYTSTTPIEVTVAVRGRRLALGVTVAGSAKILAAGFNWVNPD